MRRPLLVVAVAIWTSGTVACTPIPAPGGGNEPRSGDVDGREERLSPPRELSIGAPISAFHLIRHDGRSLSPADLEGKAVALVFFDTRCPPSDGGPELIRRLAALQGNLRSDLWDRVSLLAISLDPTHDTVEVLRQYGHGVGADLERWIFATGPSNELEALAEPLGIFFWEGSDGRIGHTLGAFVVDRRGRLADRFPGIVNWSADDLLAALVLAAES